MKKQPDWNIVTKQIRRLQVYAERRANDEMKGLSGSEMAIALTEALQFLSRELGEVVNNLENENYPYETELIRQKPY